jgi:hypothetical protein
VNKDEAEVARDNKVPVVDTYTGELGMIENLKGDGGVMVLFLGDRLAKLRQIGDMEEVAMSGFTPDGRSFTLQAAGKVHGGQKGAEGK